jgi:hypothetical protein
MKLFNWFKTEPQKIKPQKIKPQKTEPIFDGPRYHNNCDKCIFLGRYEQYDLYLCHKWTIPHSRHYEDPQVRSYPPPGCGIGYYGGSAHCLWRNYHGVDVCKQRAIERGLIDENGEAILKAIIEQGKHSLHELQVLQEYQLARAVLDGDRAAALALVDWIIEHWKK